MAVTKLLRATRGVRRVAPQETTGGARVNLHSRLRRVLSIEVKEASTRTATIKKEMYDVATDVYT